VAVVLHKTKLETTVDVEVGTVYSRAAEVVAGAVWPKMRYEVAMKLLKGGA
jgi:hypothetical protein